MNMLSCCNIVTNLFVLCFVFQINLSFGEDADVLEARAYGAQIHAWSKGILKSMKEKVVRMEYRMLNKQQRKAYHDAINVLKKLKFTETGNMTFWDRMITFHNNIVSPPAHEGISFMGWHREYLIILEAALRHVSKTPDIGIPYFDSSLDHDLPDPTDSVLWTEKLLGNNQGAVVTGPFANWSTVVTRFTEVKNTSLIRSFGAVRTVGDLFYQQEIEQLIQKTSFDELFLGNRLSNGTCVNTLLEQEHVGVHAWVGGQMADIPSSPNDPVFFMHHSFVDFLWEQWRLRNQDRKARETEYPSDDRACEVGHKRNATMWPFAPLINIDGHRNIYTDDYYKYAPQPTCTAEHKDCGSPYLFCYTSSTTTTVKHRCMSKVRLGGVCTGLEGQHACYKGKCLHGKCVKRLEFYTSKMKKLFDHE